MANTLYKMMEVNIESGKFDVLYGEEIPFNEIKTAITDFMIEKVHPNDKAKFLKFFYEHYGKLPEEVDKVFYRRRVGDEWRFSVMEAMELNDPIVLVTVRDVENYIQDFLKQMKG